MPIIASSNLVIWLFESVIGYIPGDLPWINSGILMLIESSTIIDNNDIDISFLEKSDNTNKVWMERWLSSGDDHIVESMFHNP